MQPPKGFPSIGLETQKTAQFVLMTPCTSKQLPLTDKYTTTCGKQMQVAGRPVDAADAKSDALSTGLQ